MAGFSRLSIGAAVLLCIWVALNALRYLLPDGGGPDFIMGNAHAATWLGFHAGTSSLALLLGPAQFMSQVRLRWPRVHRWIGRTYVVVSLAGAASGMVLATGATTGPTAGAGFLGLGILWFFVTARAWRLAMVRRFEEHRAWMIRSFSLALAGVALRIYLPISMVAGWDFNTSYTIIAYLAWMPNLLFAELYIQRSKLRVGYFRQA